LNPTDNKRQNFASPEEVTAAFDQLVLDDGWARIVLVAQSLIADTPFSKAEDLINEMMRLAITAKPDENGRGWPKDVPFIAYAIQTMKGLAIDSREAFHVKSMTPLSSLGPGFPDTGELPGCGDRTWSSPSVEEELIAAEDEIERDALTKAAAERAERVHDHFKNDPEVMALINLLETTDSNKQAKQASGWSTQQYERIRKRLLRGRPHLFPTKSVS
jgi:hypothetical protein